ncbi:hypothetical protein [Chryseobacterium culicis]|jgi:hypothetical protein|uniref:Uncharacterized protein n=1 Tax=Chryseobacterium culicis TaxID=680127 RepID=A0A1H6ICL6_CHRCI|nr:hypothetical protein [Chryseobacterium culicis]SEH45551.1 hypothetical protein SAMN05421593_4342 [Chryseobacterium culicis]
MKKINITSQVKELSDSLFNDRKTENLRYYPIDKFYILAHNYLEKILSVNHLEFIFYNLEMINETYTVQLLLCLPELWENVTYNDMITLIENFTNSFSFYVLMEFTHKYLEIDLMDEIFYNKNVDLKFKKDCIKYFPNIIASLYMNEFDYIELEENLYGVNIEQIKKIQLKFKNDSNFKSVMSKEEVYKKLSAIKI